MNSFPLKVIALGLGAEMQPLLDTAWHHEAFKIVGVADPDGEKAAGCARRYECTAYDDFRQLIIQSQADVLMVGLPVYLCLEQIQLAIEKKMHLFKLPPAGLNFEQAAQWTRETARQERRFIAIQEGRFHPLLDPFRQMLDRTEANFWHLISAVFHVPQSPFVSENRWLYDPSLAGGGVLLRDAYRLIDELVLCFGLPQRIYAQTASQAPDRQQRMSLTEDIAVAVMRFSDTLIAQFCASRTLGPTRRHLRIHGKDRILTLTPEELTVTNHKGEILEQIRDDKQKVPWGQRLLDNFAGHLARPEQVALFPPPQTDLKTMAVIEAAYLSAKTGMPEEPTRILNLAGFKFEGP